jgi:hypothetical protein
MLNNITTEYRNKVTAMGKLHPPGLLVDPGALSRTVILIIR